MIRRIFATLAITASILSCAGIAQAYNPTTDWYSRTQPLRISDGGYVRAAGYGVFHNYNGQYAMSTAWTKDKLPGGHGVTVKTGFYFDNATFGNYALKSSQQTPDWFENYFAEFSKNVNLQHDASKARGEMRLCENRSLAPDVCSGEIIRTWSY